MLTRPRDREVVCHASAWDMDDKDDVRIKMCIKPIEEDLFTIYHELGHVYYYIWYKDQPALFQDGAHDGFHEAIGDAVNLSVTPGYLHQIGLVERGEAVAGSRHQPADEDGARQDRLPAVRQAHRRVALGACSTAASSPPTTTRPGGSCARSTRASSPPVARTRGGLRSGREVPHPRQHAVHALLPVVHPAVPVPQGAVRGRRASRARCTSARSSATRKRARSTAPCWRSARASPGRTRCEKLTGTRADGRLGDHRLLQAARSLARRAEQGPELRLGLTGSS